MNWLTIFAYQVSKYYRIPIRAIIAVTMTACLLGLVHVGSSTAFDALVSMSLIGHHSSFVFSIFLLVLRRLGKKEIPWGPWTLGRWGLVLNLSAMVYSILLIIFSVFPPYQPVTAKNMNYAGVIFGAVLIVSILLWFAYGRKFFKGPIREIVADGHLKTWYLG